MPDNMLHSVMPGKQKQAYRNSRRFFEGFLRSVILSALVACISLLAYTFGLRAEGFGDQEQLNIPIASFIIKEKGSPKVLLEKDVDRPVSPASLTKVMTCIMAIESGRLDEDVVIPKEATLVEPSKAGFTPGERIKLVDLVKAAMVSSSNDAAFAIAIHLAGNVDTFVAFMNRKAKVLGMNNSRFTNPAGFDKGIYLGNHSSAGDLMRLTEYAVKNPVFNSIARLETAVFIEQSTHKLYSLRTHNKLLDKYPYTVGIKTGFTARAGKCLIARAVKDNKDVLLVMLNAKTDRWGVAAEMFDSVFTAGSINPAMFASLKHGDSVDTRPFVAYSRSRFHRYPAVTHRAGPMRRSHMYSRSGRISSKHEVLVSRKNGKHAKHDTLALRKNGKHSKHSNAVAFARNGRRSKSNT
ncbi:MAG: D-alanyl-D-alanine carboxypeptidase [Chlorobium sp.]|nr:MAG: D-alanyl-D-alanine carboxypeptidase [Chlorobium sp.]